MPYHPSHKGGWTYTEPQYKHDDYEYKTVPGDMVTVYESRGWEIVMIDERNGVGARAEVFMRRLKIKDMELPMPKLLDRFDVVAA